MAEKMSSLFIRIITEIGRNELFQWGYIIEK